MLCAISELQCTEESQVFGLERIWIIQGLAELAMKIGKQLGYRWVDRCSPACHRELLIGHGRRSILWWSCILAACSNGKKQKGGE